MKNFHKTAALAVVCLFVGGCDVRAPDIKRAAVMCRGLENVEFIRSNGWVAPHEVKCSGYRLMTIPDELDYRKDTK